MQEELSTDERKHLFGNWHGERTRWRAKGIDFDVYLQGDTLWNPAGDRAFRTTDLNRVRGSVNLNLAQIIHRPGLTFHATGVWQAGGRMGEYLGLLVGPSSLESHNTARLDSYWLQQSLIHKRLFLRVGQFAGQDFYGVQYYGGSFVSAPLGYALGNLYNTREPFDPPSTPAFELRVLPTEHLYLKAAVMAGYSNLYDQNPTGFVPQFRGRPVNTSEIGYSTGHPARDVQPNDSVDTRKGYSGLYRFGAAYSPDRFMRLEDGTQEHGNKLLYWSANQAVWRRSSSSSYGPDAVLTYDWSPASINRHNRELTAGLRWNEPLPIRAHNTISLGYVRDSLSDARPAGISRTEHGIEANLLWSASPAITFQPTLQYYSHAGGTAESALVVGFRTRVEF